jgi:CRISPR-associated exonuclease Cas4
VTSIEYSKSQISDAPTREALPLSLLNDYLYCPRRAALKIVEGWREANVHTDRGDIVHEHSDLRGYEVVQGVKLLRALPVFSERLGLNGKCDIVEVRPTLASGHPLPSDGRGVGDEGTFFPVEFKVGKRRQWANDDAQLCAQAMCLEEMFGGTVPRGAVFHADSKRRREVEFTAELRQRTEATAAALHALGGGFEISDLKFEIPPLPAAVFKPACEECSLFAICLPQATSAGNRAARLSGALFEV